MKKIVLTIFTLFLFATFCAPSKAIEFSPKSSTSLSDWGIGVYVAPKEIQIYSQPDEKSKIVEDISWNGLGVKALNSDLSSKDVFIVFESDHDFALMSAVDELDDWCEVVYNRNKIQKGWVKKTDSGKFYSWYDFMNRFGKEKGLTIFSDIPETYQKLRTNPNDSAPFQKDFGYVPADINLTFIKGNWMLIKFLNFDNSVTIGWTKWRTNDGKLYAFPNLNN